ncbi:MAG: helix-turn-helix transcriptional regulator [Clostridia bacterium]|nr:helix-turn-helix transcriptional regulator [Clostridia bacterium]
MITDSFLSKFIRMRKERNMSVEDVAQVIGISADAIRKYESGFSVPSVEFVLGAEEFMQTSALSNNLENTFTQGHFGSKIPLLTEYDLINDCSDRVIYYLEIPHLEKYGKNNLFALRYTGADVPDKGILHNSTLIFVRCEKVDRDGIYAIVKRETLSIKSATLKNGEIRLEVLDGKRRAPNFYKTSKASGRLVCCINDYE